MSCHPAAWFVRDLCLRRRPTPKGRLFTVKFDLAPGAIFGTTDVTVTLSKQISGFAAISAVDYLRALADVIETRS